MMIEEILKKADECIDPSWLAEDKAGASVYAKFPAMFIYIGDKAAESCGTIRDELCSKFVNGGSILHAVIGAHRGAADFEIHIDMPSDRGTAAKKIREDYELLSSFNLAVKDTAEKLMRSAGFPEMTRCFLFIVADSDSSYNAVLPEFVMLFSENVHIRMNAYLFTLLSTGTEGYVDSAAFFRELDQCEKSTFTYDGAVLMREQQRIPVQWEGAVFEAVFLLEMYRSDLKYSVHNGRNNARIAALTAVLTDKDDPVSLPDGRFFTAGTACVRKPVGIMAHVVFRAVTDILGGLKNDVSAQIPVQSLAGYDTLSASCDGIIRSLPDVRGIGSVLPASAGTDPDTVRNTNVRNILEYYGGEDERYFDRYFEKEALRLADINGCADIGKVIKEHTDKGRCGLGALTAFLSHDGELFTCVNDVLSQLDTEEEALNAELDRMLSQPCPEIHRGLFSKATGCDILAQAVSLKYSLKLDILRIHVMKRSAGNILAQAEALRSETAAAAERVKALSDSLGEAILKEIYDCEYSLGDAEPFTERYGDVAAKAVSEAVRLGTVNTVLRGKELWDVLTGRGGRNTDELADIALELFHKIMNDQTVREAFSVPFDEELYARYRDFGGGREQSWVDSRLVERIRNASRADLRYSVFQPVNSLYCMGNEDTAFVKKMMSFDDPAFTTVNVRDVAAATYEELAVYGIPSLESVVSVNECRKIYDKFVADNGDTVYCDRSGE